MVGRRTNFEQSFLTPADMRRASAAILATVLGLRASAFGGSREPESVWSSCRQKRGDFVDRDRIA